MNNSLLFMRRFLSILLVIYFTQINYHYLSKFSVAFIGMVHNSGLLAYIVEKIAFFFSYILLFFIIGMLLAYTIFVNPNFVRKSTLITFFSWTIGLFSFLKLFLEELRPFMFSILYDEGKVEAWDCETDYGMPSAHMIFVVSVYYFYKVVFYC